MIKRKIIQEDEFCENVQKRVNKIIEQEKYEFYSINRNMFLLDGTNYVGTIYEVDIKGKTEEGSKETNLFIKAASVGNAMKEMINVSETYAKEAFIYRELSRVLDVMQENSAVPMKERYKFAKSFDGSDAEVIILENLSNKGYQIWNARDVVSLKFAEMSIRNLAKFHALSFVLEKRMPEFHDSKVKSVKQSITFSETWQAVIEKLCLNAIQDLPNNMKIKIENFLPIMFEKCPKYWNGVTTSVKCLCHGDYRINNLLIKYHNQDIIDMIPIDYQFIFYGSPVTDLIYFLFGASDQKFRKNHLNDLKELYFDALKDFLKFFNIDVETVYPRKTFDKDYRESLDFGLIFALYILPLCITPENDAPDFNSDDVSVSAGADMTCTERIEGIVRDFIDWGYL